MLETAARLLSAAPDELEHHAPQHTEPERRRMLDVVLHAVPVRVAGSVVEVNDVDGPYAGLVERDVVIGDGGAAAAREVLRVAELLCEVPDALHDFRGEALRIALGSVDRILIADHVEQNAIQRLVPARQVSGEVCSAEV